MPALIPILIGTAAVGGALSNRPKTTTSTNTSNSSWNNTSTNTPNLDPIQQKLYELLTSKATARLNQPTPLGGYEATGLSNINKVSDSVRRTLENRLASNGISGPAAGSSLTQLELARAGEATRFQNSLPLLSRQMGIQDEGLAAAAFGLKPIGSTSTSSGSGTTTGTGSTTTPGNMLGGAFNSVGSMLGYLAGMGQLGQQSTAPTGVPALPQTSTGTTASPIPPDIWKLILGAPNYGGGGT